MLETRAEDLQQHAPRDGQWRAQELKRRIENRRQSDRFANAYEFDDDDDDDDEGTTLVSSSSPSSPSGHNQSKQRDIRRHVVASGLLPSLLTAKHDLYAIQNEVFESDARQLASIRAADQHFSMHRNLRLLKSDLDAVASSVRRKADRLDDLHSRVLHLTRSNTDTSEFRAFARSHIADYEAIRLDRLTIRQCPTCKRTFLPHLLERHQEYCSSTKSIGLFGIQSQRDEAKLKSMHDSPVANNSSSTLRQSIAFISQPPRNFRLDEDGASHNKLRFVWDVPIFTGSQPIVDYELRYAVIHSSRDRGGEMKRTVESMPAVRTSHWCLQEPCRSNAFTLGFLTADQEYGDFSLSAVTKCGLSTPSNTIASVKTTEAVAPSQALFLTVGAVTAKTITLSWTEPMDDGGKPIVDYEIAFVEAIMEETITFDKNFLDVSEVVYKPRLVRTYSADTTFTVVDLLSGKEHKEFQVRAVNSSGIPGEFSECIESIFTIAPGNEFKLLDELQAAVNARTRIIDSLFLSGFMQRYERHHYIDLVSRFIVSTYPELEPKVNAILTRSTIPPESLGESTSDITPNREVVRRRFDELSDDEMIAERRRQFHFRIAELEKERKRVEYNVQWCRDRRVDLVALIRAAENRILEKQAELERARMFRGPQMDSDVLENGLQRFYTKDLVVALEDEIEIEQLYIADTKVEIVKTENYLRADEKRLQTVQDRLVNRREALAAFEVNPSAPETDSRQSSVARIRDRVLYMAFAALVEHRDECKESRRKMRTALDRVVTCKLRVALKHWRLTARAISRELTSDGGVFGVGSAGLLNASLGRDDLATEAREMLKQLRHTDQQLESIKWTDCQQNPVSNAHPSQGNEEKFHPIWLEADSKMDVGDFEGARRLYEYIESNPTWTKLISIHQAYELQKQIGVAWFQIGNHEQALQRLERALIFATRRKGGSKVDEGTVLCHIGDVHFASGSVRQSLEHFERALLCFEVAQDQRGQLRSYRGMQNSYEKLEDTEMAAESKQLADEIEFALQNKIGEATGKLQTLQQRLVGIGAESSKEIVLERVKANVTRLRRERIKCKYKIREENKWAASLEKLLKEKKSLLAQGELDLKRALASDSTQVDSMVINGTNARYEIEDFKRKLAKLMGGVKAAEEHITKEILNSNVRVRNAEDEIKELESELFVETGALMRRMLSREPIRCFKFNATNEALKNVIGTASHGVTTCVAAVGLNGLLFDLLSGACLSQALGDPQKEHLGDPIGHQALIVSVFCIGNRIYTGSMDCTVGVWEIVDESIGGYSCGLKTLLTEFDSAVVSIHADVQWLACGCSDRDVFLFDVSTLRVLARVIGAHERSTTALFVESFKSSFTTGGADHRLKVWEVSDSGPSASSNARKKVKMTHILEAERRGDTFFNGHLNPVTCVRQIANEIVSGDTGGRIVIWNLDAIGRKMLRYCDVHKAAVTSLQFDAMKIVSASMDFNICVTDFATGHLMQTLVGHEAPVLDMQYDRKRIISMSADGKLRLWYWQTRMGIGADRKKYHILGAGETLKSLSLKYRTSIDKLLKWNNLPDSSKMYLGQKLVVEIDSHGASSDELQTLDMNVSVQYGKLAYENLDFLATHKLKSSDVESQWAAQKLAQLAKDYFPPLTDDDDDAAHGKGDDEEKESEADSDEDSNMAVDSENEEADENDDHEADDAGEDEKEDTS